MGQDSSCTKPTPTESSVTKSLQSDHSSPITFLQDDSLFPYWPLCATPVSTGHACAYRDMQSLALRKYPGEMLRTLISLREFLSTTSEGQ